MGKFALMTTFLLLTCVGCQSFTDKCSYFQIRDAMSRMTRAQWGAYVRTLAGTEVECQGWVDEVNKKVSV